MNIKKNKETVDMKIYLHMNPNNQILEVIVQKRKKSEKGHNLVEPTIL